MKKSLLILFMVASFLFKGFGQCEPDTLYTLPGIYPDSATGFPPAYATYEYNLVITAVIPADTLFLGMRRNIDSIGIFTIIGLPEGFEALPNSPSGYWPGGSSGCLLITGTPTHEQVGEYPLQFVLYGYAELIPFPIAFELTYYSLNILDSIYAGVRAPMVQEINNLTLSPNPFSESFTLHFNSITNTMFDLQIFDLNGRLLFAEPIHTNQGMNNFVIDRTLLRSGVYFCRLTNRRSQASTTLKLIKY
jgi:hypothetical protein